MSYMGQTGLDAQKGADILSTAIGKYSSTVEYPKTPSPPASRASPRSSWPGSAPASSTPRTAASTPMPASCATHALLWKDVSEAVAAFFADLREHDEADNMIMLLWTEFGRRVKDNGAGTDHGAGGVAFVLGDPVKGGMYGEYPSLKDADLTIGNLKYNNDFRSTYATILEKWIGIDSKPIVNGSFEQFNFV